MSIVTSAAAIAQLGERQTEDLKVPGSIPGLGIDLLSSMAGPKRPSDHGAAATIVHLSLAIFLASDSSGHLQGDASGPVSWNSGPRGAPQIIIATTGVVRNGPRGKRRRGAKPALLAEDPGLKFHAPLPS